MPVVQVLNPTPSAEVSLMSAPITSPIPSPYAPWPLPPVATTWWPNSWCTTVENEVLLQPPPEE